MKCKLCRELIDRLGQRELKPEETEAIEAHFGECESCRRDYIAAVNLVRDDLAVTPPELPVAFTESVMKQVSHNAAAVNRARSVRGWHLRWAATAAIHVVGCVVVFLTAPRGPEFGGDMLVTYYNGDGVETRPLTVTFTDQSAGSIISWHWTDTGKDIEIFRDDSRYRWLEDVGIDYAGLGNGGAIVDDRRNWYGDVHANEYLRFRNRISGLGEHFYGGVTSSLAPGDYTETGGSADAAYTRHCHAYNEIMSETEKLVEKGDYQAALATLDNARIPYKDLIRFPEKDFWMNVADGTRELSEEEKRKLAEFIMENAKADASVLRNQYLVRRAANNALAHYVETGERSREYNNLKELYGRVFTDRVRCLEKALDREKFTVLREELRAMHQDFDRIIFDLGSHEMPQEEKTALLAKLRDFGVPVEGILKAKPAVPNGEAYDAMFFKHYGVNPEIQTDDNKFSTFGVDVDTASYTLCRRYLNSGHMPPEEAVRVEEFVNFFDYGYAPPEKETFAIYLDGAKTPFAGNNRVLLRVGIKARDVQDSERKDAIITFVVDTSGSMSDGNRINLVKAGMRMLVKRLRAGDRVAIVKYSTSASEVIAHTPVGDEEKIMAAIDSLHPTDSTNAYAGLKLGYELAAREFDNRYINKVILCSDGVANVAHTDAETILKEIDRHRRKGITLFCVGVGMGNYNDELLEKLGDKGDGHYAYIDNIEEAERVFIENVTGNLLTVARDAKVQVEFDPKRTVSYRLLGYENRRLKKEDFKNDKVDAGEIGAGHSVTALYVVKLRPEKKGKIATVRLRWKDGETGIVEETQKAISSGGVLDDFDSAKAPFKLAAVVAQFAEVLRKSYWADEATLDAVVEIAASAAREMNNDSVREFSSLAQTAVRMKRKIQLAQKKEGEK